jgi:hypothetical protein
VATLGTLYLSLSAEPGWGVRNAFVAVLVVQITVAGVFAAMSRRLPDPVPLTGYRTGSREAPPVTAVNSTPPTLLDAHTSRSRDAQGG